MILHTIVNPLCFDYTEEYSPEYVSVGNGFIEIKNDNGAKTVERLFSTDPLLYLDKRYAPGSKIE